jgi:AraC-like DNA-binding protein
MPAQRSLDWIQVAAALGAVQGLLLAIALAAHPGRRIANRLLAALMASFTVYLASTVFDSPEFVADYPHLFGISYPLPWLFGPLVYLYAVTASDADRDMRPRDWLHLAPPLLVVLVSLPIYLMSGPEKVALYERMVAGDVPTLLGVVDPTKFLSGIVYSVATVRQLNRHRRRVEDSYSTTEHVTLRWLLWLTGSSVAIWLLAVGLAIADRLPLGERGDRDDLVAVAIAVVVYAIGYAGLRQPEIHRFDRPAGGAAPPPVEAPVAREVIAERGEPIEAADAREARYERSRLGDAEAAELKTRLLSMMDQEHPYRDADLTLADLAARLDTTPHKLSQVLNGELAQSFYEFVNGYRVAEVRRRLVEHRSEQANVLAIAMDAGFASKSTFNQAFKRLTGHTPSTYRRTLAVDAG